MATQQRVIEALPERIGAAGEVAARKMFGEYGIFCDGRFIGVVCDNRFHLKPTAQGRAMAPDLEMAPAYAGAKPSMVVPDRRWDDADWLVPLVRVTAAHVPAPKKRKARRACTHARRR